MIEFVLLENDEDIPNMRGKGLPRTLVVALGRISVRNNINLKGRLCDIGL